MKITRVQNSFGITYLRDKLVAPVDQDPASYEQLLRDMLAQEPERLFVIIAYGARGEQVMIQSFVIAYAPANGQFVQILQEWSEGDEHPAELVNRLLVWVGEQHKQTLRIVLRPEHPVCKLPLSFAPVALVADALVED